MIIVMWWHETAAKSKNTHSLKAVCFEASCDIKSSCLALYPKPGGLDVVQPQPGVGDLGEFGDGGGAVAQHEAEAHGTENRRERRQVQLPVLHFAVERKRNRM